MNALHKYDQSVRQREQVALIGGVDEAGRGALAGPVVAAVVVLAPETLIEGVNDSKQLSPEMRERLAPEIVAACASYGVGLATPVEIGEINILQATHLAAKRAMEMLTVQPEHLITDFLKLKNAPCALTAITKGDATSLAVAAASVLAKVARDRIMMLLDAEYPQYMFARHKGYGTEEHLAALQSHGPSAAHRMTFKGVCWFDAAPKVRCASTMAGVMPKRAPKVNWGALLGEAWREEKVHAFLAESEFRAAGEGDKVGGGA